MLPRPRFTCGGGRSGWRCISRPWAVEANTLESVLSFQAVPGVAHTLPIDPRLAWGARRTLLTYLEGLFLRNDVSPPPPPNTHIREVSHHDECTRGGVVLLRGICPQISTRRRGVWLHRGWETRSPCAPMEEVRSGPKQSNSILL